MKIPADLARLYRRQRKGVSQSVMASLTHGSSGYAARPALLIQADPRPIGGKHIRKLESIRIDVHKVASGVAYGNDFITRQLHETARRIARDKRHVATLAPQGLLVVAPLKHVIFVGGHIDIGMATDAGIA